MAFPKEIGDASGTLQHPSCPLRSITALIKVGRLKAAMRKPLIHLLSRSMMVFQAALKSYWTPKKTVGGNVRQRDCSGWLYGAWHLGYAGYKLGGPALKKFLGNRR